MTAASRSSGDSSDLTEEESKGRAKRLRNRSGPTTREAARPNLLPAVDGMERGETSCERG